MRHPFFEGFNWLNIREKDGPIRPKIDFEIDTQNFPDYGTLDLTQQEEIDQQFPKWRYNISFLLFFISY